MIERIHSGLASLAQSVTVWMQGRGQDFAADLVAAAVILLVGALAIRVLARVLRRTVEERVGPRTLLVRFLVSVAVKCAWAVLLVIVLEKLGVAVAPLIAGLGITGVVLGFAFQESLGSLAAGIMLAFNQPFKIGDAVIVGGHEGTVKQLDMMAVVIVTKDAHRVTIPNKQVWSSVIVNLTAEQQAGVRA